MARLSPIREPQPSSRRTARCWRSRRNGSEPPGRSFMFAASISSNRWRWQGPITLATRFSPDGQWIAFFADAKLKKIAVSGGATVTLCDAPNGRGGTWTEDGTIIFSPNNAVGVNLLRVSSSGGTPEPFSKLEPGEVTQRYPQVLPGGK